MATRPPRFWGIWRRDLVGASLLVRQGDLRRAREVLADLLEREASPHEDEDDSETDDYDAGDWSGEDWADEEDDDYEPYSEEPAETPPLTRVAHRPDRRAALTLLVTKSLFALADRRVQAVAPTPRRKKRQLAIPCCVTHESRGRHFFRSDPPLVNPTLGAFGSYENYAVTQLLQFYVPE